MIIRLSKALARKVKLRELVAVQAHENALLDWSLQMFVFERRQHVIFCNTTTLYSAVFLASGLTTPHALAVAGVTAITEQLEWDHLLDAYQSRCPTRPQEITYGASLNKRVTGSINEQILRATYALADGENLQMTGADANRNLLSILKGPDGRQYGTPCEAMEGLLEGG
jgi:hypothetical protein